MRAQACLAAVLATGLLGFTQESGGPFPTRIERIENGLVEFSSPGDLFSAAPAAAPGALKPLAERMRRYNTPGLSLAVIDDFRIAGAKAYGVLKAGGGPKVDTESLFEAASTSKMVTAVLVLHYADRGVLDLDRDVNAYLKAWKLPENELSRERKVTLRLLLTHQAGLPATNFTKLEGAPDPTLLQILKAEPPATNKPAAVESVPGTKWRYSNIGYVLIQRVLEEALGRPFAQLANEVVFKPLGMRNSTFVYPLDPDRRAREAWPHDAQGILKPPAMSGSAQAQGGLMTTPSDLALFAIELMKAYQGRSDRMISRAAALRMLSPAVGLDPAMFGLPMSDGLGVFLHGGGDDLVFLHPGGNSPGSNCLLIGNPAAGRGAVVMSNGEQGELLLMEVVAAVNREYGRS
jgi:CubicO group peptidase (beta-lactamase class C family)